jgi:hypothetical protein
MEGGTPEVFNLKPMTESCQVGTGIGTIGLGLMVILIIKFQVNSGLTGHMHVYYLGLQACYSDSSTVFTALSRVVGPRPCHSYAPAAQSQI